MTGLLQSIWDIIAPILTDYGYYSLFISSFLSSTLLPMGSEALVVAMMQIPGESFWKIVAIATIGNFLGACTTYYIGLQGTDHILFQYFCPSEQKFERARDLFQKYGAVMLLFSWIPVIGDAFVFVAGGLKYPLEKFSVLTFSGKFMRYIIIAYMSGMIVL